MQLTTAHPRRRCCLWLTVAIVHILCLADVAHAQVELSGSIASFDEGGGPLHMHVLTSSLGARVPINDHVSVAATWDVDVVSGASVALVDAPFSPDVITSATILEDTRHVASADAYLDYEGIETSAGVSIGVESDYRSTAARVRVASRIAGGSAEVSLSGAFSFDDICDAPQEPGTQPVQRVSLPSSDACFTRSTVTRHARSSEVNLSLLQVVSPLWLVHGTLALSRIEGFQSNPYREVWLGPHGAQEYHPLLRTRGAVSLGTRFWLNAVASALQLDVRLYQDDWALRGLSAKIALEHELGVRLPGTSLLLRGHVRGHAQSAAHFYSDDYASRPRGQYFTGDRELSAMQSWSAGARLTSQWTEFGVSLWLATEVVTQRFAQFHYGDRPVPNDSYIVTSIGLNAPL